MKIALDLLFGVSIALGLIGLVSMNDPRRAHRFGFWCAVSVLSLLVAAYSASADRISTWAADVGVPWLVMAGIVFVSVVVFLALLAAVLVPLALWINAPASARNRRSIGR